MQLAKAIYSIREALGQNSDDSDITDREIIFELDTQRARYYENEYNKNNRVLDDDIIQTVYLELELSTANETGCTSTDNCTILRTTQALPKPIQFHTDNGILSIKSPTIGSIPFDLVKYSRFPFVGNDKYTKNIVYVTYHPNGRLYFKCNNKLVKLLTEVVALMILESPTDIRYYEKDCDGSEDCWNLLTFDYPVKQRSFGHIRDMVRDQFTRKLMMPEDKINDGENPELNASTRR